MHMKVHSRELPSIPKEINIFAMRASWRKRRLSLYLLGLMLYAHTDVENENLNIGIKGLY